MFEVNSSSKRSGKHILSQLEEATQSHLVINNKGPTPQSSFAGLFNKPVNNSSPASGPLGAFLSANATESDTKTKKGEKGKKKQKVKEKKKDKAEGKVRSILKQPPEAVDDDTESCSSLSSKAASLILFEEVCTIVLKQSSNIVVHTMLSTIFWYIQLYSGTPPYGHPLSTDSFVCSHKMLVYFILN